MAKSRTIDTAEFKLRAVRMILQQKLSVAEVARRLDVGENLLHAWRIADHASEWPITWMCDTLEVSLSGYHAWHQRQPSVSAQHSSRQFIRFMRM